MIPDIPIWAANELPRNILDESLQPTQTELKAIANVSTLLGTVEVRAGRAYKSILEVAEETSAELIIIGSHQPGLKDYFLGSTAAKVVRHARCSGLVVR